MTPTITKIKNGAIMLPKEVRGSWRGALVFIRPSEDTIIIKRVQRAPFWETWRRLKKIRNKISRKDIDDAVAAARTSKARVA